MKKASKSILIFGIILVVAFSFAILNACDKTDKEDSSSDEHNHTYGEWSVITAATCTTDGSKKRACTICQKEETENISALGHDEIRHEAKAATCTESGWEAYVTCSRCDYTTFDEIPALGHNFVDDVCVRCQDVLPTTEGLSYSLSADETSYTVVGIGTATDTDIVIPSEYNGLPVTSIGDGAFENCSNITSITIGNGVTNIGEAAFSDCSGLKSITIPASVTNIRYGAFAVCTNLTSITVNAGNSVYHSAGNCLIEAETKTLILGCNTSVIPDDDSVMSIGDIAFFYCDGLTSITIPDGVTSIGEGAFYYCSKLTSITIPASVTSIGSDAFSGTAWYNNQSDGVVYAGKVLYEYKGTMPDNTQIEIIDGTKSIADYAFSGCSGLTSITIPDSVTNIGRGAFSGTAWYNNQPDGVVYAGKVLYEYKGTMPDNTQIEIIDGTKSIADNAFYNCSGLTSVTIPDSVTSIGRYAFYNCSGLTSVTIPDSVTSIGRYAF
ncbi:MAG: leucine-rich repeat domain-containing protein, partial [Christensenellales bacterium]